MVRTRRKFTVVELLLSIAIIAILFAILLPGLSESRARARFIRWVQFNKQCSADPACVINLNFQDGKGNILLNSALGHEAEGFNAKDYSGIAKGDYEWTQGRWWKGKKALQFDGTSTYVEFPHIKHIDFDRDDNFTIIIWVKFDRLRKWDGVFGKCYMRNATSGYAQYDMYFDGTTYDDKVAAGQFEVDVASVCVGFDDVGEEGEKNILLDTVSWFQLTLRNEMVNGKQEVHVFFNGIKLKSRGTNFVVYEKGKCKARLALGCIRWLVTTYNKETKLYEPTKDGRMGNFFKGRMDEFLLYNRALKDAEIRANYAMGAEYH